MPSLVGENLAVKRRGTNTRVLPGVPIWWRTTRGSKPGTTRGSGPEDENHGEPKRRTNTRVRETRSLYSDQHEGLIPRDLTRIPETPRKLLPSRGIKAENHKAYKIDEIGEDSAWCVYKGHQRLHGTFISHWHRNRNRAAAISMRGNAITYH
jgi:hypothetical protein